MRKLKTRVLSILLAAVMVVTMLPAVSLTAFAAGLPISEENFPDENFRSYVSNSLDGDKDGALSDEEISAATEMDLSFSEIKSLAGIEYFKNLTYLRCDYNQLTSLDVSNNPGLIDLYCDSNKLTTLDVSNNPELTCLSCGENNLATLNVSNNPKLINLYCYDNKLTTLDVSNNPELKYLYCDYNNLTMLDVSNNPELSYLKCEYNNLTMLDLSKKIGQLSCYDQASDAELIKGDDGYAVDIGKLVGDENREKVGVSDNTWSYDSANGIAIYLGSGSPEYLTYDYYGENLESAGMDVTLYFDTTKIPIDEENFPDENFRTFVLNEFDADKDCALSAKETCTVTKVDFSKYDKQIESLTGIENFVELNTLDCTHNKLTTLDVSQNLNLTTLECDYNQLTTLDVSQNSNLGKLHCGGNQLTSLDVSQNLNLTTLDCGGNRLATLDVSQNLNLTILDCDYNQLATLDVSQNGNLGGLYCRGNQLTSLDVSQNHIIGALWCSGNQLSTLIVGKKGFMEYFNCSDNLLTTLDLSECSGTYELYCDNNLLTSIYLYGDAKPAAASENINRLIPRDGYRHYIFSCKNNRFTALDLSQKFDYKYCSGQTSEAEMVKTSDGYAVDLGKLVGDENKAKVTVPKNWSYDSETGIAACTGTVAPETLKYNYFGLNLPTSGMDVTLSLTVKNGGEIEPDKDKILVMKKEQIKAYVDGQLLPMTDYGNGNYATAKSMNGTYALPLRCIGEAFNMRVDYLGSGKTKITNAAGEYVVVTRDSNILEKYDADNNLINSFTADFATFTDEAGITYAPMRAVSEALGLGVSYVGSGTTVHGSYVAVSTDITLNLQTEYVLAEIEKAYALGL